MITLLLMFEGKIQKKITLKKGQAVNIGRKPTNDIIIDNAAVSGKHAEILYLDKGVLLTDLNSKNGTFVNQTRVNAHWLQRGDVVTICKHQIVIPKDRKQKAQPVKKKPDADATMILDTKDYKSLLNRNPAGKNGETALQDNPVGVLTYISGGSGHILLNKNIVKIGRDTESDVVIKGITIGKTALTITRRPDGYYLNYIKSFSKPRVNEKKMKGSVKLNRFDRISLGAAVLEFGYR